jgi:FtsP/CotA-like multicopper oxidase with cupredoxin domain
MKRSAHERGRRGTLWLLLAPLALLVALPAAAQAALPGGTLDPTTIPKFREPLVIPPAMPRTDVKDDKGKKVDYYRIAVKQFRQYILPMSWSKSQGIDPTTVWSYASMENPRPVAQGGTLNYPALTIEARYNRPVRVQWINGLVDRKGNYLPHLLPVDANLHWANPPGGSQGKDGHGHGHELYTGPVPIVTHVHGSHTHDDSDGYAEAWYLPDAKNIPAGYARTGTWYGRFKSQFRERVGVDWRAGTATFQYPNDQRAGTTWYHDHTLGMTRLNVYAGPAGFYLIRGGKDDLQNNDLPTPAPQRGDKAGTTYREIPIAIQDRSFNKDGSLFYPDNRAFFEGLNVPGKEPQIPGAGVLDIPFMPHTTPAGQMSDIAPAWNPEFFGNTIVVNGKTWPYLKVEKARYRLRFLNGTQGRFLILRTSNDMPFWQIGTEGGFLPEPVKLNELLLGPAERADVIVDFSSFKVGTEILLQNYGPDEPFGGGEPFADFQPADPATTGQVMQFRVVARHGADKSEDPKDLKLPKMKRLPKETNTRYVALLEADSATINVATNPATGNVTYDPAGEPFGPESADLGTYDPVTGVPTEGTWDDPITERPKAGTTEVWTIRNYTMDAHPIHIHMVQFEVVNREVVDPMMSPNGHHMAAGTVLPPEPWETGYKDTVIVYPGELARVRAKFDIPGLYVWHCHIVEHEDNEMMRPFRIVK